MSAEKHVITYPGFAESADAKKLYDDLKKRYRDQYEFHILPFYEEKNDDRVVHSIDWHAGKIQECIDALDGEIIMLSKCGGTRPTVAMDDEHLSRLSKLCLINPPWMVNKEFLMFQIQEAWKGTENPEDGSWAISRGEGMGNYVVTQEYIKDATTTDLIGKFNHIGQDLDTELYIVRSMNDKVIPPIRTHKVDGAKFVDIEGGDHHLLDSVARERFFGALALNGIL